MKKRFTLITGLALILFAACKKESVRRVDSSAKKTIESSGTDTSHVSNLRINDVDPGPSTIVYLENGRYVAHFGFGDVDLGNVFFHSGSYVDGEAVNSVGIGSGPFVSIPYSYLEGTSSMNYFDDLSSFHTAWAHYINDDTDPTTNTTYTMPYIDDYINPSYGTVGIFKGVVVRDHGVASTLVIRDADFNYITYTPPRDMPTILGRIEDPVTHALYDVAGHDGIITEVYDANADPVAVFSGTYQQHFGGTPNVTIRVYTDTNTYFDFSGPTISW
ncbi:hypothetical protein [Mucilaginibacter segetis]|uniref:Uncharacterized protein n=1 Tax=Mucilaginibacter segetis TaxID=2793071 RepID=A0A934PR12_9SPHI|nr:hypothetical protein [Mucilaginibacter segetis]MBK0377862.1 hypothetical protein [Mucilaginibacter segetis]